MGQRFHVTHPALEAQGWRSERRERGGNAASTKFFTVCSEQHRAAVFEQRTVRGVLASVLSPLVSVASDSATLWAHISSTPSGSPIQGILQERILEWFARPYSRGFVRPRD